MNIVSARMYAANGLHGEHRLFPAAQCLPFPEGATTIARGVSRDQESQRFWAGEGDRGLIRGGRPNLSHMALGGDCVWGGYFGRPSGAFGGWAPPTQGNQHFIWRMCGWGHPHNSRFGKRRYVTTGQETGATGSFADLLGDSAGAPLLANICLMPRSACLVRSSFSMRLKRTWVSP